LKQSYVSLTPAKASAKVTPPKPRSPRRARATVPAEAATRKEAQPSLTEYDSLVTEYE